MGRSHERKALRKEWSESLLRILTVSKDTKTVRTEMAKNGEVILMSVKGEKYHATVERLIRKLSKKKVLYVSYNRTCDAWRESCAKKKLVAKNTFFVDAVSSSVLRSPAPGANCAFVSSPGALTELAIIISEALKGGFEYLVFDSLTALAVHATSDELVSFVANTIARLHDRNVNGIFFVMKSTPYARWLEQVKGLVDKIVEK